MANSELSGASHRDVSSSGISWAAVIGGAFVAAAISLIMLSLGAGFELSSISLWSSVGMSARGVGTTAMIWLLITQIVASSFGGYLAGRLRTRWTALHNDEVHFRDTANGLLAWAVSVVVAAAFFGTAASVMTGRSTAGPQPSAADQNEGSLGVGYYADRLFSGDRPADPVVHAEASRFIAHSLRQNEASSFDETFLTQLVAGRTGLSPADAGKRVSEILTEARQTAENLRKATARLLMWTFLALLIGAFCASYAATIGGRQRDRVQVI
jgi:hypothetical protein